MGSIQGFGRFYNSRIFLSRPAKSLQSSERFSRRPNEYKNEKLNARKTFIHVYLIIYFYEVNVSTVGACDNLEQLI